MDWLADGALDQIYKYVYVTFREGHLSFYHDWLRFIYDLGMLKSLLLVKCLFCLQSKLHTHTLALTMTSDQLCTCE